MFLNVALETEVGRRRGKSSRDQVYHVEVLERAMVVEGCWRAFGALEAERAKGECLSDTAVSREE